jgi:hypothetical protein
MGPLAGPPLTTHQHLVLERRPKRSIRLGKGLLDLSTDARHGADVGALELGHFERRVKHVFDERRVLEDFVGHTGKLELLNDLGSAVDVEHDTSG